MSSYRYNSFESTFPSVSTYYLQVEPHEMAIPQVKNSCILACAHQTHFVFLQSMQKNYFPDSLVPWLSSGQNCCMTLPGLDSKLSPQCPIFALAFPLSATYCRIKTIWSRNLWPEENGRPTGWKKSGSINKSVQQKPSLCTLKLYVRKNVTVLSHKGLG